MYNKKGRIGIYTPAERTAILQKFKAKRERRTWPTPDKNDDLAELNGEDQSFTQLSASTSAKSDEEDETADNHKAKEESLNYSQIKEAASASINLGNKLPGPGWLHSTFLSGGNKRPVFISPDMKIQFDTSKNAFVFEQLRSIHADEFKAWDAYKEMKKSLGERLRGTRKSNKKVVRDEEKSNVSADVIKTDEVCDNANGAGE